MHLYLCVCCAFHFTLWILMELGLFTHWRRFLSLVTTISMQHWSPETQHLQSPTISQPHLSLSPHGCTLRFTVHSTTYTYTYIIKQRLTLLEAVPTHCIFPPITMRKVVFPVMAANGHALLASLQLAVWQANPFSIFTWWDLCWLSLSVEPSPHFHCTVLRHSTCPKSPHCHPPPPTREATTALHPAKM